MSLLLTELGFHPGILLPLYLFFFTCVRVLLLPPIFSYEQLRLSTCGYFPPKKKEKVMGCESVCPSVDPPSSVLHF